MVLHDQDVIFQLFDLSICSHFLKLKLLTGILLLLKMFFQFLEMWVHFNAYIYEVYQYPWNGAKSLTKNFSYLKVVPVIMKRPTPTLSKE